MIINFFKPKDNCFRHSFLFLTIMCAVFLLVLSLFIDNSIFRLVSYCIVYVIITVLFLVKYDKNLDLNVPLLITTFYTLMIGISPVASAIYKGCYPEYQYFFILFSYFLMLLGYHLAHNKYKTPKKEEEIPKKEINYDKEIKLLSIILLFFSCLAACLYLYKNSALLFSGDINNGRIKALSGNGILVYTMSLSTLSGALLFDQFLKGKLKIWSIIFVFILVIIVSSTTGFRMNSFTFIIFLLLLYNCKKKIKIKYLIFLMIPLFFVFVLIGVFRNGDEVSFLRMLLYPLQGATHNIELILEGFPADIPFQKGYSYLINFIMLRPGPDLDFTLWLKDILNIQFSGGGLTPTLIGEFYLNFGYAGTYIGMFVFGIFMNFFQQKYEGNKHLVFYCLMISKVITTFYGGLGNIEIGVMITSIVYIAIILLAKFLKKTRLNKAFVK